jgi:hypothetical protein
MDNMTAVVVKFPAQSVGNGGGVLERRKFHKRKKMVDNNKYRGFPDGF